MHRSTSTQGNGTHESLGVRLSAPSGPRPAGNGRGQGRTPSQSPAWQTGSRNNPVVVNVSKSILDCTVPWLDTSPNYWPLDEHHYAEVLAVCRRSFHRRACSPTLRREFAVCRCSFHRRACSSTSRREFAVCRCSFQRRACSSTSRRVCFCVWWDTGSSSYPVWGWDPTSCRSPWGEGPSSRRSPWGEDPSCCRFRPDGDRDPSWSALAASASRLASSVPGGSKSTCPRGVVGKRGALSGEQPTEAGPDRRLHGVVPHALCLVDDRLGLEEPSCNIAW